MHFLLRFLPMIWNFAMIKLNNGKYAQFPKILGMLYINGRRGNIYFGKDVQITSSKWINPVGLSNATSLYVLKGATIRIGNNVGISNSLLYARAGITIDDEVMIGGGCQILDSDFHSLDYRIRVSTLDQANVTSKAIRIKRGAFIGAGCIILKGLEIGEQSIIAAGSVLSKSVPDFEIWGGNPARFIRKL
jgi:acetyltransferase-like isoleucine patch superfamily enzyme